MEECNRCKGPIDKPYYNGRCEDCYALDMRTQLQSELPMATRVDESRRCGRRVVKVSSGD